MTSARRRSTIPTRICSGSPRTHRCSPSSSLGPSALSRSAFTVPGVGKDDFRQLARPLPAPSVRVVRARVHPVQRLAVRDRRTRSSLLERIAREVYRQEPRRPEGTFDGGDWIARLRAALVVDAFRRAAATDPQRARYEAPPRTLLRPRRCAREPEPRLFSGGDCELIGTHASLGSRQERTAAPALRRGAGRRRPRRWRELCLPRSPIQSRTCATISATCSPT